MPRAARARAASAAAAPAAAGGDLPGRLLAAARLTNAVADAARVLLRAPTFDASAEAVHLFGAAADEADAVQDLGLTELLGISPTAPDLERVIA